MGKLQREVYGRHGRWARRFACTLLGGSLLVASTVALDTASSATAVAAGSGRAPVPGHQGRVPPGATLVGPAPSTTTLPLVVTLEPRDPAALAVEAQAVSDPASPEYRHFLKPSQFAKRFGPTSATIAQITSALRNEGLTVGTPSSTGLSLPVSGTVAQVQSAFSTPISKYRLASGKTGYDNAAAPEVPLSVAPQIEGILGLDTLSPPQPSTSIPQASPANPHGATLPAAPSLAPGQPSPKSGSCATSISSVESDTGAHDAVDLSQAYSFDPLYSANHYGAGTTVALLEMSGAGYLSSDITNFATCYGITLGGGQVSEKSVGGGGATGGATVEAELDIETVLSLAPKANIEVYEGGASDSIYDVFSRIVSDDTAKIVSASWTNGCEAYVGQSLQNSENTLFQAAATEGQSIFAATGDQGSEGCNINGEISASTGSDPTAQAVDPSTGTLYIANDASGTVSVDSEGSSGNRSNFVTIGSVSTGTGPDAIALDSPAGKVFVANSGSTLTAFSTGTCNQSTTSGCSTPTQVPSGGHLNAPTSLAVYGSTLYVGNSNGTVALYNATTNAYVTTLTLAPLSHPTALAVDATNGVVYVADGGNNRIEYFSATTCNASTTSGCSTTPATVSVGHDPVALAVANGAGDLYVANAGSGGGISVLSLSTQAVVTTISTSQPSNGTGLVQSIGMSPDNNEVLAVLNNLSFPGDVMATINTSTQSISATVNLETGSDAMGQLVSDGTLGYAWVTDETKGGDVVQNLNLAVSDPASQPYVTAVGGTSLTALGPTPTEEVWNDQLFYSEGAGGGGVSTAFSMPAYQQPLGTVSGSSGTPCSSASGDCREIPDVSADADPSTGYVIYDTVNGLNWTAVGGTSGAAPLWAAVLAVVASANANTAGYGALNPALYLLAQQSPGTYLNDITVGNNDYNATQSGQYPAMSGFDMATGLGTPVASQLAAGLTGIPLDVVVSGTQTYGGSPTFGASANYDGSGSAPFGVTLNTSGLSCTEVGTSTTIGPTLPVGSDTLVASSCGGLTLSGADAHAYTVVYTSSANDFTVAPAPVNVAVSGTQTYGSTPSFTGTDNPPSGITVTTSGLSCTEVGASTPIAPTLPAGSDTLLASSCSGAMLSGTNAGNYAVAYTSAPGDFAVSKASLSITASSGSMTYGGSVPTITAGYTGFVNGDSSSSLTTKPTCSTTATSSSPVSGSPYVSSCGGAVDPNYTISYVGGTVTVNTATLTITAASPTMTYGGSVPTITAGYTGFVNGDSSSSLTTKPTCSTTATSSSSVSGSPYASTCSGAVDPNYTFSYVAGSVTVSKAPLSITASGGSMTYGGTAPTITPGYTGFVNGDNASSLSTPPTCSTTATSSSPVAGSPYASTCSGAVDSNYTISYVAGSVTVSKAPLSITASSGSMTYGGTVPTITPGYTGFVNGDSSSSLTTKPTCSTTATRSSPVAGSPYASSCSGAADSNYTISYVAGSVTVSKAPLSITASSGSMTYGGSVPTITAGYTGFVNGDSSSSLTTKPTCSTTATNSSPVSGSPYVSSCGGAVDPNYTISYFGGTVTVNTATLTITAASPTMTYGGSVPTITAGYTGFVNGDSSSSLTTKPTCSTTATSSSSVSGSPYASTCSGAVDPNYTFSYVAGSVTVSKAPLSITASGGSMTYGGTAPTITPGYTGFVNGDNASSLSTPPTCSTTATSSSPVAGSPYASTCSGAVDSNYTISYVAGSVTVSKAPLSITASSGSMTYGGTVPTITPGYTGFVNGDSSSSLTTKPTCSTTALSASSVAGSPYASSCSGAVDPNYTIGYVAGSVTVNPALLTVTAASPTMTYGGSVPTITAGYTGFKNGDKASSLTSQATCSTTATNSSTVSGNPYASTCSGAVDPNYTISYVGGSVTVTPAPLTVIASGGTMTYGIAPPSITFGLSGFVNGDNAASLSAQPACSTTASSSSSVSGSPYAATCSGAVDPNYSFIYVAGSVTVTKAPLTITASSGSMTYGGAAPTITAGYAGFVNSDSASSLTIKPSCSTAATSASSVAGSPYTSSCTGAVDPNYAMSYVGGSVTVGPAPLTITASSPTMTYGGSVPPIAPIYTGLKNGDGASSLTVQPTCSTTATISSTPSPPTYPSSCSGASDPNYSISYAGGATTVRPAPVAVTVDGTQNNGGSPRFAGSDGPPAGVTVDTNGLTCSEVTPSTPISAALPSGAYTVVAASCGGATLSGPNAANYAVSYAGASGGFIVTGGPVPPPPPAPAPAPAPPTYGYWLVGSDGGIFTFGSTQFHGSTGSLTLQRPVVGISPTASKGGYWLVASDGGVFAFGDAGYFGSMPGDGFYPAGSGLPHSLNAPIVGMVPSADGGGYFMVASDGGVFAFGDAKFEGSCPGIGGCSGSAVSVVPDADGGGYWLVTQTGQVYGFGDAPYYGAPGAQGSSVTSAVRTADGHGYWILLADGAVYAYGDAAPLGGPVGSVGGLDPASAIFSDADGGGYWVASASGAVFPYGDAPNDGSMAGTQLNASIIAATGF